MLRRIMLVCVLLLLGINITHADNIDSTNLWFYNGIRALFMKNDDGTVNLMMDWHFIRINSFEPKLIHLLIPTTNTYTIEIPDSSANINSLNYLYEVTKPQINEPYKPCGITGQTSIQLGYYHYSYYYSGADAGVPTITGYTQITGGDRQSILTQLAEQNYSVDAESQLLLDRYIENGMSFILLDILVLPGVSQTIQFTYESDEFVLPLILLKEKTGLEVSTPILLWVFILDDERYTSDQYQDLRVDLSHFRQPPQIIPSPDDMDRYYYGSDARYSDFYIYQKGLAELASYYDAFFVTEFAGSTDFITDDEELWMKDYPYLTRMVGSFNQGATVSDDLRFVPASIRTDVSNQINIATEALDYWGCHTQAIESFYFDDGEYDSIFVDGTHVTYPKGWVVSYDEGTVPVTLFAPQPVTLDNLVAFFEGGDFVPMMLYISPQYNISYPYRPEVDAWMYFVSDLLGLRIGSTDSSFDFMPRLHSIVGNIGRRIRYGIRRQPYGTNYPSSFYAMFYEENDEPLSQIFREYGAGRYYDYWIYGYDFYAHQNLKHTVFMGDVDQFPTWEDPAWYPEPPVYLGFADGWISRLISETEIVVKPDVLLDDPNAPQVRLISHIQGYQHQSDVNIDDLVDFLVDTYSLNNDVRMSIQRGLESNLPSECVIRFNPVLFEKDGRKGYIALNQHYLLEASAPIERFDQYADILFWSAESFHSLDDSCA